MPPKRRRGKGEGAVYRRANDGLWVGMLDLGVMEGRRRRKTVYGQTEREVLQKVGIQVWVISACAAGRRFGGSGDRA